MMPFKGVCLAKDMRVRQTAAIVSVCWRWWHCSASLTEEYQSNVEMKDKRSCPRNWICDAESPSSAREVFLEVVVDKPECENHCMHKSEDKDEESPGPLVDHPPVVSFPDSHIARCISADLPRHQHFRQRRQARSLLHCTVGGRAPGEHGVFFHGFCAAVLCRQTLGCLILAENSAREESTEPAG